MKQRLTDLLLRSLIKPRASSQEIWDQQLRGFGYRASKLGTVAFFVMERPRGRRKFIRLTLSRYPILGLAEARQRARAVLMQLADGSDPRTQAAAYLSLKQRIVCKALDFLQKDIEPACYLYRHYHPSGDLLYVGISLEPLRRQGSHLKVATWRDMICHILIEPFATREEALAAEETAIRAEFPRFNFTYNQRRHPFQELSKIR